MSELEAYEGAATIEKVASLCRRRGFVYPSSDIYGGLGSSYDYGHYGVLLKQNVKDAWQRSMVQEREDIVLLDSAIILHPQVWVASGHVGGFSDPLVDCRTCKLRFRADHLEQSACGSGRRSSRAGRPTATSPRRGSSTSCSRRRSAPSATRARHAYLRPETAQGIFVNFKNVTSSLRVKPPFGIAQIGKSFRNEITPGNFLFRMREFEQMEMEYFVPPAEAEEWYRYWIEERRRWYLDLGLRESHLRVRAHDADELSHYSSGHERPRVPLPDRLVGARGDREPRRLRPAPARRALGHEARVDRPGRALRPARDRARGRRRPRRALVPRRRLRRGGGRRRAARRAAPPSADGAGQGGGAAAGRQGRRPRREGAPAVRGPAPRAPGRVRRLRVDRQALPPPGRDRHAVGAHDRPPDARGRHGHAPRPRHARAGADPDRGRARAAARPARAAVAARAA